MMANRAESQLPDGSTVPDFTFSDLNGVSHHLYSYLNEGKYVALEVSTTWCHPCWLYHGAGVMDSIYTRHDDAGDSKWNVLFVEGDATTTAADLNGTGTNTQGNWVTGTLFPIMNPTDIALNDFLTYFNISTFPTLEIICPNKKVFQDTLNSSIRPGVRTWEYVVNTMCVPTGLDNILDKYPLTVYPNPAKDAVTLYFALNTPSVVTLKVSNCLGQLVDAKTFWVQYPGDQAIRYDVSHLQKGIYFFNLSDEKGHATHRKVVVQ